MKRASIFFLALTVGLFVAGSASAGYLEITYDLAGSTLTTAQPLGTFIDPLTGQLVIRFGASTSLAPITSATLVSGNTLVALSQDSLPSAKITGTTDTVLSPGTGVVATGLGANTVTFPVIPATVGGFLHCSGNFCGVITGLPAVSVNTPITGSAATLPPLSFAGGVANGTTFAGTLVQTPQAGVLVTTNYVGTETDRIFVPEPGKLALLGSGIATLVLLGALRLRRNG